MMKKRIKYLLTTFSLTFALLLLEPNMVQAHCDGIDGPVVAAARRAIENNDLRIVLLWAPESSEAEISEAFQKTLSVRKLGPEAKEFADTYFFETLVRIHRAGEGAPYTGLKPAGRDLGPAIPAGDKAIKTRSINDLQKLLTEAISKELGERFREVIEKSNYSNDDTAAGREYASAYVDYIHYVEGLYEAANGSTIGNCSLTAGQSPA
ncbi:MAG: DUF6448 family protein [Acidobacteriota bacterium]